ESPRLLQVDRRDYPASKHHGFERYSSDGGHDELVDYRHRFEILGPELALFHRGNPCHRVCEAELRDQPARGADIVSPVHQAQMAGHTSVTKQPQRANNPIVAFGPARILAHPMLARWRQEHWCAIRFS